MTRGCAHLVVAANIIVSRVRRTPSDGDGQQGLPYLANWHFWDPEPSDAY